MAKKKYDVRAHILVPKHAKLSENDRKSLLKKYNITLRELPKISIKDPAIAELDIKVGDIIKVTRSSPTGGESIYYRGVTNE